MKTLLTAVTLMLAMGTVWADSNPVQQQIPLQLTEDIGATQGSPARVAPAPVMTEAMLQILMQQAENSAAEQTAPAPSAEQAATNQQRLQQ